MSSMYAEAVVFSRYEDSKAHRCTETTGTDRCQCDFCRQSQDGHRRHNRQETDAQTRLPRAVLPTTTDPEKLKPNSFVFF